MTAEDKKNFATQIQNALTYHAELSQKLAQVDKRKEVPVLAETVYRFCNKFEDVVLSLI